MKLDVLEFFENKVDHIPMKDELLLMVKKWAGYLQSDEKDPVDYPNPNVLKRQNNENNHVLFDHDNEIQDRIFSSSFNHGLFIEWQENLLDLPTPY